MKGKTAREVAEVAEQFRQASTNPLSSQQPIQQMQYQPNPLQAPDPQLAYSDPPTYARQAQAYNDARFSTMIQQAAQPILAGNAQNARTLSQLDPKYAEVWRRWGNEIDIQANNLPVEMRNKQAYDLIAKHVKSDHIEELSEERAQQILTTRGPGTEPAGGFVSQNAIAANGSELDAFLRSDHPEAAKYRAVDRTMLVNYIRGANITEKQWVEDVKKGSALNG